MKLLAPFFKTRLAPTPSGFLHLGNAYSFFLTHYLAKKADAQVLLRIDDIDVTRKEDAFVQEIFEDLNFLEINWDLGPKNLLEVSTNSQLSRLSKYQVALKKLKEVDAVYACTCSRNDILKRNPSGFYDGHCRNKFHNLESDQVSWRFKTDCHEKYFLKNEFGAINESVISDELFDFIVKRKDGLPAYQLSSLCDDETFKIDFIFRGQDLFSSSIAQIALAKKLEMNSFLKARFFHHELLYNESGKKLSKTAGDTSIKYFREKGYTRNQIIQLIKDALSPSAAKTLTSLISHES